MYVFAKQALRLSRRIWLAFFVTLMASSVSYSSDYVDLKEYSHLHPYIQDLKTMDISEFSFEQKDGDIPHSVHKERYLVLPFKREQGLAKRLLGQALGAMVGYLAHEAGHKAVARAYGHELHFEWQEDAWWCEKTCYDDYKKIAMGGMLGQKAAAEIVMLRGGPKNAFEEGILLFDFFNSTGYVFMNEIHDGSYGDFSSLDRGEQRAFGVMVSGHTILRTGRTLWKHFRD